MKENGYDDPYSEAVRRDRDGVMRAGGYKVEEAWGRALRSGVASLDLAPLANSNHDGFQRENIDVIMGNA